LKQREVHRWVACVERGGPPHACAVMPWGGVNSYFMLGVGGCNYDASTTSRLPATATAILPASKEARSSWIGYQLQLYSIQQRGIPSTTES
jgi:hypothetical protein